MLIAESGLLILLLLLSVPVITLFIQVVLAVILRTRLKNVPADHPSVVVLIPAHDEASVVRDSLESVLPQLLGGDRILLVADNCIDDTAEIAESLGVEVIERHDSVHKGKGYALDFGIRHLRRRPPDIVIVLDADCCASDGLVDTLSRYAISYQRPVQSLDLMVAPTGAGTGLRVAEFAWIVKNHVRPLGMAALGMPCQLMGTGMAFPWSLLDSSSLASGHIVEDMQLGLDLALRGYPAMFCPDVRVTSRFPEGKATIKGQRTRWEHGHLGVIIATVPRLLAESLRRRDVPLFALALDLMVPPLALLLILVTLSVCVGLLFVLAGGGALPLLLSLLLEGLLVFSVLLAWHRFGRHSIALLDLTYAPLYALRKIPIYLKFWTGKQREWVRSRRDGD